MKLLCTVSKIRCVGNRDIKLSIETGLNDCALIDNEANCVQWALDRKKQFTTKSLYRFLTDRGLVAGWLGIFGKVGSFEN